MSRGYDFYLDRCLLPVTPEKLEIKINNGNKTVNLINDGEINILKKAGLSDVEFECMIPQIKQPYAIYKDGFKDAAYFLEYIEKLKTEQKPFQFIVVRRKPDGKALFNTNMKVSLEDYKIKEDAGEGFDVGIKISLKQYRDYSTKTVNIVLTDSKPSATVTENRGDSQGHIGIGSDVIVNGRLHRDSYGKGPGQTRTNYRGKINYINMKGSHPYHVTTPSGSWLGWVTADSVKAV